MYLVKESPCWGFIRSITKLEKTTMKLLLTAFCAIFFVTPLAFAESAEKKCEKKCDKDKQEETLANCGKCGKGEKHEEGKDAEKKEGTLAHCGKCDKKCDKDAEKKEGTLA